MLDNRAMMNSHILASQQKKVVRLLEKCHPEAVKNNLDILVQSDFLVDCFAKHPHWLDNMLKFPPESQEYKHYKTWLDSELISVTNEPSLLKKLRQFRNWILSRIEWSQLVKSSSEKEILQNLSILAELIIIATRDYLYDLSCKEFGTPHSFDGNPQPLLVLGMGKLGGGELNFSSDIDLIFCYPEHGVTKGGRREIDNSIFFTRLGQKMIKALDQSTEDGFVYRVDMRLRPLGDGGPLVLSFSAMEDYYQEQGRDWERYAMVKAKILGDQNCHHTKALYQLLKPFVYRRYIDFSVLQSLRNMKGMIEREVRRRSLNNNIKLGAGGIREIEFIVQVFQLIRGGRVVALQTRSLLAALAIIQKEELLPEKDVLILKNNYLFLRRCENIMQGIADQQTQALPDDELGKIRLTLAMGFESWTDFYQHLTARMDQNRMIFRDLIGDSEAQDKTNKIDEIFQDVWMSTIEPNDIVLMLKDYDDIDGHELFKILTEFRHDIAKRTIGVRGREILDQLMPRLIKIIVEEKFKLAILKRILPLVTNIVSRTTYLELLLEYPSALSQLIRLCAKSPMISDQITHYPILLDELININSLYQTLPLEDYKSELYQYLLRISSDDEEQQLEALRQFKQMQLLHIAAADVEKLLPTMKISDHLTFVAEALIEFVVQMAWRKMTERYGVPDYLHDDEKGIIVVGYGKLGGIELGYSSDLDLVFLHDCPESSMTTGAKKIDSRQFYLRLIQRIIHLFNVRTSFGVLYDIDLRLRPQGEAGLLACSLTSFEAYLKNDAWIWEHQALVRARCVYGDRSLITKFNHIRHHILSNSRTPLTLKSAVREMREKMRRHLGTINEREFDLKIDAGGIGDIEFLSQFLVLNYAHNYPKITKWTDNVRILACAADYAIMDKGEVEKLTQIYITMRNHIHHLSLQHLSSKIGGTQFIDERESVKKIWSKWLDT